MITFVCDIKGTPLTALVALFPVQQEHSNFKLCCQINRGHIRVPENKFWYTKYVGDKKI